MKPYFSNLIRVIALNVCSVLMIASAHATLASSASASATT
jgi:hypothetical protein